MDITRDNEVQDINSVRIEHQQKKKAEYKLIGKMKRVAGLTLFSYKYETKVLKPAEVEREVLIHFDGKPRHKNKIKIEKGCIYFQALNIKTAKKKLSKLGLIVKV